MKDIENFSAGHYEKGYGYKYFVPEFINTEWVIKTPTITKLLEKAALKLGELNSYSKLVPDIDMFIKLHVTKEAMISSRIEGTQTTIDEALLPKTEIDPERRDDWQEVSNYSKAITKAITDLKKLPISTRLIQNTHKILMQSVRGKNKMPGMYRTSQNWIGGASLADAAYISPYHDMLDALMSDLEKFLNNDNIAVPDLIRIAIAHYQFETIHPFLDGNGRIGRLLITLFLVAKKILDKPLLYLSIYFEKDKGLYYDNLTRVREKNDMKQWVKYFLVGVEQTATKAVNTLSEIIKLKAALEKTIVLRFGRRANVALEFLGKMFSTPIFNIEQAAELSHLSFKAANSLVEIFVANKMLVELTGQSRNRIFKFNRYLDVFDDE